MKGVSLKELIKDNIQLAEDSLQKEDDNTLINALFVRSNEMEKNELVRKLKMLLQDVLLKYEKLPSLLFETGLKLDDSMDLEEAVFFYRLSHLVSPNPKAINNIAIIYAQTEREKYAIDILKQGQKQFPNDQTIAQNLQLLCE